MTRLHESVRCIRLALIACEALTAWGLVRLLATFGWPAQRVLLYLWHPLVVWEFSSGGHVDALMIACLVWSFWWYRTGLPALTGVGLGCAVAVKLFPVLLAPALYRRWREGWKMPVAFVTTLLVVYLPYLATYRARGVLGFLPQYASEEGLQSGDRFFLLNLLPAATLHAVGLSTYTVFVTLVGLTVVAISVWVVCKPKTDDLSYLRRALCLATLFTAVLSSGFAWYASWLVPFLCFLPYAWLFWLTASSMILYMNWLYIQADQVYLLNAAIYLPAAFLGLQTMARRHAARWTARPLHPASHSPQPVLVEH